ncbi:hypothetical protein B0T24DRAFT_416442 [Lasiosphaeria ovina]|uniref:Uncharacterized protein n=1 Tax=Lasiosphaeria ovina TaxID=92902 RepID=A0AAE0N0D9_9PEZI|nr:hypothetical protein B0T24DRAFT_416442 [Lasiosphaeria ovina]
MLVWSHSTDGGPGGTALLSAIAICHDANVNPLKEEARVFSVLAGHPVMPVLVCCSSMVQAIDKNVESTLCTVKDVEAYTGLFPDSVRQRDGEADATTDEADTIADDNASCPAREGGRAGLGEMSGWMSEASVQLAKQANHLGLVRSVITKISEIQSTHIFDGQLKDVAQLLMETSGMTLDFVEYLGKRVDVQHVVLANLIARDEAEAAFRLAADSKQIAESTASDGFAMMTIAIMTMFFLPATFFATVFAMPIIGWDAEKNGAMMMPQMWLYVELALPVTIGIFMAWLALTYWRKRGSLHRKQKRQQEVNKLRWRGGGRKAEKSKREPGSPACKGVPSRMAGTPLATPEDTARKAERLKSVGTALCGLASSPRVRHSGNLKSHII